MKKYKKIIIGIFVAIIIALFIYEFSAFLNSDRKEKLLNTWAIGQEYLKKEKMAGY
jgi:uncharacterized protein YxeA